MRELASLSESDRKIALDRYRILRNDLEKIDPYKVPHESLGSFKSVRTVFYTTGVINTPGQISSDIHRLRSCLQSLAREPLRREATQKLKQIDIRDAKHRDEMFVTHDWLAGPIPKLKPTYAAVSENYIAKEKRIGDPTRGDHTKRKIKYV